MKRRSPRLLALCLLLLPALMSEAQTNGTNSSYSRFGLGLPADQSQGYNRSMGGVAQGLRSGSRINIQNPASYSAMDSLTFLFDVGMGLNRTRYTQEGSHRAVNNTSFDYLNAAFRLAPHLGMSVGFMPYSKVGYSFSQSQNVASDSYTGENITNTFSFSGSGGLHKAYLGAGWQPFKGVSFGANVGYMWGNLYHAVSQSFEANGTTSSAYNNLYTNYSTSVRTWTCDVALQLYLPLNADNTLTLGATVGIGHDIGGTATILRTTANGDTITASTPKGFSLPMTYSVGAAWVNHDRLTIAADYTLEQWSRCHTPHFNDDHSYSPSTGDYTDRWRLNAGAEYVPDRFSSNIVKRINYRVGAYYSSPYLRLPQHQQLVDGPCEYGITAGLGIPLLTKFNRQYLLSPYTPTYLNVGVSWARRDAAASGLIAENIMSIHIGITFNERWFMKWKFK